MYIRRNKKPVAFRKKIAPVASLDVIDWSDIWRLISECQWRGVWALGSFAAGQPRSRRHHDGLCLLAADRSVRQQSATVAEATESYLRVSEQRLCPLRLLGPAYVLMEAMSTNRWEDGTK